MSLDLAVFAAPDFDPNDYANAILAAEPYPTPVVISKLSLAIEDTSKQIKNLVATHHEDLLSQASGAIHLSGSLASVKTGLSDLESSLDKLRLKIRAPYQSLGARLLGLQKLQEASDVLRRASRFVVLARRLQLQMLQIDSHHANPPSEPQNRTLSDLEEDDKERTIAKAALSIAELESLAGPKNSNHVQIIAFHEETISTISLRSINAVAAHIPFIEEARAKVASEMENMVLTGLTTLNQSLLASSLQTAYNLRVLPDLVRNLILDLSQAVEERICSAFDISKISKDALAKDSVSLPLSQSPPTYRSRVRTEPTNITAPQFTAALWSRLEVLIEEMADCCIKVHTLEKVLKFKKDTVTGVVFLEEAMKSLDNKPSATFWTSLGRSLEKHARESAKSSTFLQQTLSNGYPKLLRLFQEFFAKIALHTDTVYSQSHQSPETVFTLRSLSTFESLYLSRSSNKINEAVAQGFSGGVRTPPGYNEGINIARAVANELDSARFDPLLVKSVAKNAVSSLEMFLSRVDGMVVRDCSATTLVGPTATPQQILNAQLASCLYHCWHRLDKLKAEHSEVSSTLQPSVEDIYQAYENIVEPIRTSIRREFGASIAKLHRVDFGKTAESMAGMGGTSVYMKDLVEKLAFVKTEVYGKFNIGEAGRTWLMDTVSFVIRHFVLHASIARPLTETGKLQLTSDMTELEFGLSAFMIDNPQSKRGGNLESIGEDYRALRAMRPLLFLDNALLAEPERTDGLPPLVVLHHIIVRSPIPLPHELHGWQEAEYVRWLEEHTDKEAWTLIEGVLVHWEKVCGPGEKESRVAKDYIRLARMVLAKCR